MNILLVNPQYAVVSLASALASASVSAGTVPPAPTVEAKALEYCASNCTNDFFATEAPPEDDAEELPRDSGELRISERRQPRTKAVIWDYG